MDSRKNQDDLENQDRDVLQWVADYFDADSNRILISSLLALQSRFGYLPKTGIRAIAERMGLSAANAYGVATFYNHFRFTPPGKHAIQVCTGTACHIKQATKILEHWERRLSISTGEVTQNREYSLDRVACVGCCSLAPVTVIGDAVFGDMSVTRVDGILFQHDLAKQKKSDDTT